MTPVCEHCGSEKIQMIGKHGYCVCKDCGEEGHAMDYEDWESGQEWPHEIPAGYAEP